MITQKEGINRKQGFPNSDKKWGKIPLPEKGEGSKTLLEGIFLPGSGNLRDVLTILTFLKAKNNFLWILNIN